jgi:rRNA N6-adenosine-methyltransferase METTL5
MTINIQSIASKFCGASHVVGVDIDQDALETAWVNLRKNDIDDVDLINCDVQRVSFAWGKGNSLQGNIYNFVLGFDTVVMNPPFGTRNAGIDTVFLEKGMAVRQITNLLSCMVNY